ncbi:hypothetical protein Tco_0488684 [Tanacetum coccineum]
MNLLILVWDMLLDSFLYLEYLKLDHCYILPISLPELFVSSHGDTMTMSLMHQWHDTICGDVIGPRRSLLERMDASYVLCSVQFRFSLSVRYPIFYFLVYICSLGVSLAAFSFPAADTRYSVELANRKITEVDTNIRGCVLNNQNHLFKIDLMLVGLGSFDVTIGIELFDRIDTLELDNLRLGGMLCVERKRFDHLRRSISMYIDYRELNKLTVKNRHPLPSIDGLLFNQLQGFSVYSEINDMPFGLNNTSEAFMDLMNRVYKPYLDKFVIVLIDDISICSSRNKDYGEHLRLILELREDKELSVEFSKCEFWLLKVQFLSHVVDSQGIHVDTTKIESIKD